MTTTTTASLISICKPSIWTERICLISYLIVKAAQRRLQAQRTCRQTQSLIKAPNEFVRLSMEKNEQKWKVVFGKVKLGSTSFHLRRNVCRIIHTYALIHYIFFHFDNKIFNQSESPRFVQFKKLTCIKETVQLLVKIKSMFKLKAFITMKQTLCMCAVCVCNNCAINLNWFLKLQFNSFSLNKTQPTRTFCLFVDGSALQTKCVFACQIQTSV